MISDLPGPTGGHLEIVTGAMILVNELGITIQNGQSTKRCLA